MNKSISLGLTESGEESNVLLDIGILNPPYFVEAIIA
jgi:hypothetical protein